MIVGISNDTSNLLADDDDQRRYKIRGEGCANRAQVVFEGGGVVGGGVHKGGAAAVYKMLIASKNPAAKPFGRTHILRRTAPQSCPPKWVTKGPGQFTGHFAPLPRLPACLLAPIVCLGKGSWGAESNKSDLPLSPAH